MKYEFDAIFVDTTSPRYYDRQTLEKQPMGGTEATVVRVAEGLASLGLKIAVVQYNAAEFEPVMGQHCFFMHAKELPNIRTRNYIQIRQNAFPEMFPGSKKYLWMHDICIPATGSITPSLQEHNITVIGVSQWHKNNIRENMPDLPTDKIRWIYNPVPEDLFAGFFDAPPAYDPNLIVWVSSPHKGLGNALEQFKEIRKQNEKMQFLIFNPGYLALDVGAISTQPGVTVYGGLSSKQMWPIVKKALCVFYPTEWKETFGLIAAEANALGTPLVTMPIAALKEVVSSENQFVNSNEEAVAKVLQWSKGPRPLILGKDEFKFNNVILQWVKLLAR